MVKAVAVAKSFKGGKGGRVEALRGTSFTARPGRIMGLLGVNGAGKTTLLRILSTVIAADEGDAWVAGYDVSAEPERVRASIGFLSSSTAAYGRLTPVESLMYFGGLYGLSGPALVERVGDVVARLNISPFKDRLCDQLSTGQRQRVGIARTILHDPPVLFFDEPTTGLDVLAKQGVMEFIEEIRGRGKTVVFSSHVMSEAQRLCDDVTVIHDGAVVASGTLAEFLTEAGETDLERAFLRRIGYWSEATP